jgi:hypothetical protein
MRTRRSERWWQAAGLALGTLACGAPAAPEGTPAPAPPAASSPPPPAAEVLPGPAGAPSPLDGPGTAAPSAPPSPPAEGSLGLLVDGRDTPIVAARRGPCDAHADCAVLSGACGGVYAVLAEDAADEARRTAEFARSASCEGAAWQAAVPHCEAGACIAHLLDRPEWRSCRDADGCVVVPRGCTGFDAVARRHARAAERAWREDGCAPRPSPVPDGEAPALVCSAGACALASE